MNLRSILSCIPALNFCICLLLAFVANTWKQDFQQLSKLNMYRKFSIKDSRTSFTYFYYSVP
jgi:hypothetical protein